jgi:CTP synthase (UTP-ammonia lyase)
MYRERKKKRQEERIKSITIAGSLVTRGIEGKIEAATAIVYLSSGQVT